MNPIDTQVDESRTYPPKTDLFDGSSPAMAQPAPGCAPMGVCHIAPGDQWAGAEVQVATLLRELRHYPNLQLSAILLNPGRLADELRKCDVDVNVISERENSFSEIYREAARFLQGRNIQILHSHRYKENLLSTLLARRGRMPYRMRTQHGRPEPGGLKQTLVYAMDRWTARLATDVVISVSTDLTGYLRTYLPSRKIAVVRNGVDLQQVRSELSPAEAKQRLGLPSDALVMGTVSRLEVVKRLDLFLLAAAEVAGCVPRAHFVLVGEGSQRARLQSMVKGTSIESRVHFLGHRDDVWDVLRAFDLMVISSDCEGLPMILLEAMALGVPVASRQVGGIPEVVEDGVSGILVNSAEPREIARACSEALLDAELRDRVARAARAQVEENYSAAANAAATYKVYRTLVGGEQRKARNAQ
jgi:glycosyltransferase involved in cell wall biosynthesis